MNINYCLGFLFDPSMDQVVLIEKEKPNWQRGKLNGIGGKVEKGEVAVCAMKREFEEETGIIIELRQWKKLGLLFGDDNKTERWFVHIFFAIKVPPFVIRSELGTKEKVDVYSSINLPDNVIPNLRWIIPMCKDRTDYRFHTEIS